MMLIAVAIVGGLVLFWGAVFLCIETMAYNDMSWEEKYGS